MIDIEKHIEATIGAYFADHPELVAPNLATRLTQDLGPQLADVLHANGVDVDWADRSRFGKGGQQ